VKHEDDIKASTTEKKEPPADQEKPGLHLLSKTGSQIHRNNVAITLLGIENTPIDKYEQLVVVIGLIDLFVVGLKRPCSFSTSLFFVVAHSRTSALYEGFEQLGLWKKAMHVNALNEFDTGWCNVLLLA
jgi:hypothetical protein